MTGKRIALITGGTGGLGLATAQRFARDGIVVVVADLDGGAVKQAVASLHGEGHAGVEIDVANEASVKAAFEFVEARVGPISILCTCAGIIGNDDEGKQPSISEVTLDVWNRTMGVNATGTFLCVREFAKVRLARRVEHARVITVSSSVAQLGGYQSKAAYCASKGAVLSLTKAAARDLAALGITVNSIAPGPIDTPMLRSSSGPSLLKKDSDYNALALVPLGRIGRPEEFAAAAAYLASTDSGFVTGSTLDVNGGLRMQ